MKPRVNTIIGALAIAAAVAGGCGDDDEKSSGAAPAEKPAAKKPATGGSTTLALAADPGGKIAFDKKKLTAKAGKTTVDFTNASQVPHAVEIEGNGVEEETETIQAGKASLTVDLKSGTYKFYCPVGDHEQEGMKGVLTVK
jgi:plastocyanin